MTWATGKKDQKLKKKSSAYTYSTFSSNREHRSKRQFFDSFKQFDFIQTSRN